MKQNNTRPRRAMRGERNIMPKNLMSSSHKATNEKYRNGYDQIKWSNAEDKWHSKKTKKNSSGKK